MSEAMGNVKEINKIQPGAQRRKSDSGKPLLILSLIVQERNLEGMLVAEGSGWSSWSASDTPPLPAPCHTIQETGVCGGGGGGVRQMMWPGRAKL